MPNDIAETGSHIGGIVRWIGHGLLALMNFYCSECPSSPHREQTPKAIPQTRSFQPPITITQRQVQEPGSRSPSVSTGVSPSATLHIAHDHASRCDDDQGRQNRGFCKHTNYGQDGSAARSH